MADGGEQPSQAQNLAQSSIASAAPVAHNSDRGVAWVQGVYRGKVYEGLLIERSYSSSVEKRYFLKGQGPAHRLDPGPSQSPLVNREHAQRFAREQISRGAFNDLLVPQKIGFAKMPAAAPAPGGEKRYRSGDRIGIEGYGELMYRSGVVDGQFRRFVSSRSTHYPLPLNVRSADEIRRWATQQVSYGHISTEQLYTREIPNSPKGASSLSQNLGFSTIYLAAGQQRPLSWAGSGAGKLLNTVLGKKLPGLNNALQALIPKGSQPGQADTMRLELATDLIDQSRVLMVKFNLSQLLQDIQRFSRQPLQSMQRFFSQLKALASGVNEKAEFLFIEKMLQKHGGTPGFANSAFAKRTDLRLVVDLKEKPSFRLGFTTRPVDFIIKGGSMLMLLLAPRVEFDNKGQPVAYQLHVYTELDAPETKSGWWCGIGGGTNFRWRKTDPSPLRKNADGVVGLELNYNGRPRFVALPAWSSQPMIDMFHGGSAAKIAVSRAPAITTEHLVKSLNLQNPALLETLRQGAQLLEASGDHIQNFDEAAGLFTMFKVIAPLVRGLGVPALGRVAGLTALFSVPAVTTFTGDISPGTVSAAAAHTFKVDTAVAYESVRVINAYLKGPEKLTAAERARLHQELTALKKIGSKWQTTPHLADYWGRLPAAKKQDNPWAPALIHKMEKRVHQHR